MNRQKVTCYVKLLTNNWYLRHIYKHTKPEHICKWERVIDKLKLSLKCILTWYICIAIPRPRPLRATHTHTLTGKLCTAAAEWKHAHCTGVSHDNTASGVIICGECDERECCLCVNCLTIPNLWRLNSAGRACAVYSKCTSALKRLPHVYRVLNNISDWHVWC